MKKTFLICSLGGRLQNLMKLISSLSGYESWHIVLVLQKYPQTDQAIVSEHLRRLFPDRHSIIVTDEMTGPHLARCMALDKFVSDIWCILDDDMFAVDGYTHYDNMADILMQNKHIGILSSNWRKTIGMLEKVSLSEKMQKQNIVYTGGGMMLRQDVANIIKAIPRTQYLFDNPLWSIYSYVSGYENYRYMGSAAVHEICTKGGRRKWIKESDKVKSLPPCEWIRTRKGKGEKGGFDEYLICDSGDITEKAHQLHKENKR